VSPDEREAAALAWIAPYSRAPHLRRTREWAAELCPDPPEALVLAALTHDIEEHYPAGPVYDPETLEPGDFEYRWQHSVRSAQLVEPFLHSQGATDAMVAETETLILLHELGGDDTANVLQAADSLAFLETDADRVAGWVREGRCSCERAKAELRWHADRIRIPRAGELARPALERALLAVDLAVDLPAA
jgi:hypothetical protein